MSSAPLALYYCVERPGVMKKPNIADKQNIVGRYNSKFAKGAG